MTGGIAPGAIAQDPDERRRGALLGAAALGALSLAGFIAQGGSLLLAAVPFLLTAAAVAVWRAPLRRIMLGLLVLALFLDSPSARPAGGVWQSPLYPLGRLFFDNLNNTLPVSALRFAGVEALLVLVLALVALRRFLGLRIDRAHRRPEDRLLDPWLLAALGAVVWLEVWGIARGGNFKQSLWQFRELLWLPILAWLFTRALKDVRDFLPVAWALIAAAAYKTAVGLYFLLRVVPGLARTPAYVMTHDDTVLLVVALAILLAAAWLMPTRGHVLLASVAVPWLMLGLVINDRRIAFVSLAGALLVTYSMLRGRAKRAIAGLGVALLPVFVAYLVVGANRSGGIWGPAAKVMSVITQKDASSGTRDIENYNLITTLRYKGLLLGSGWGHEYVELSRAYDISNSFAQYRYIAHNSVLWLWSIGGLLGFTALWLIYPVAIFWAARGYACATKAIHRVVGTVIIAAVLAHLVQAWGDMGTQAWLGTWITAVMVAMSAKLAAATGAADRPAPPGPTPAGLAA
ncbi:MAG: O-antigen ligase family protein [Gemmatimonadaceae bacterium]